MTTTHVTPAKPLARQIALLPLVGIIFFSVSGGAYSLEEMIAATGPGLGLLLLVVVPVIYGIPIATFTTELATAIPAEGGTYVWAKRGLGDFVAFQSGALRWINSWIDMAIYPVLFASYLSILFAPVAKGETVFLTLGPLQFDLHWLAGVILVIVPMGLLNIRGAKSVGDSALLFTIFALAPLMIIAVLGVVQLVTAGTDPFSPFIPESTTAPAAIGVGLSYVMWSYCGFDRVGLIAGEIKEPGKTIPKAMVVSMIVIIAAYVLPLMGALAVPGWESWVAGSFGDVALVLGGPWLQIFVTVGGMFCAIGLYSSLLMSSTRTPFVLSRDLWITPALARQTKRSGSPFVSIIVSSIIYAAFSLGELTDLVVLDVFLINLLLLVNLAALIALRIKEPNLPRPARVPGGWFGLGALAVPMTASLLYLMWLEYQDYGDMALWVLAGTLGLTTVAYFPARAYQRHKTAALQPETAPVQPLDA